MKIPKLFKTDGFWVLVFTLAYIVSGLSQETTVWQVVVVVATYLGGSSLKEFSGNVLETLKKIDTALDKAGISWEDVLEDAAKRIGGRG